MKMELIQNTIELPACEIIGAYADMSKADWDAHRLTGLGGSESGGILGLSKWTSQLSIWMDKTGRSIPDDLSGNEFVTMGNLLEPFIRRELVAPYIKEKLGLDVEVIDPTHMYRSKEHPFMIINVDGFLRVEKECPDCWNGQYFQKNPDCNNCGEDHCEGADNNECRIASCCPNCKDGKIIKLVGLEIKTGNSYVLPQWGGVDGDELPDSYYAQDQHYMAGTGLDEWWTFGLIGNQRLLRIVPRNELFIADMIEKEAAFWELVKLNDPLYAPMPTGSDADMKALFELGNPQEDSTVDLSDVQVSIDRLDSYKSEEKDLKSKIELEKQRVIMALGTSKYGESPNGYKVTYSRFEKSSFDKAKFMKDNPGMLDPYTSKNEQGRLSIKSI